MSTIIIHGPQGCGKTRHAQAMAALFRCSQIVEDWDGRTPVPAGALVLTQLQRFTPDTDVHVYSFDEVAPFLRGDGA